MTISGRTRIFGLLGDPVVHSLSPRLCNAAFTALGEDAVYVAWPGCTARVAEQVAGLSALGVVGANVTYPLKSAVLPHLESISPVAEAVGAANVLMRTEAGGFRGENTDAPGLVLALRAWSGWTPDAGPVAILGAGSAARAAARGLLDAGATITLLVRDVERAQAGLIAPWATELELAPLDSAAAAETLAGASLVVQATTVGLDDPEAVPLVAPHAAPQAVGFELNYGPRGTAFVRSWRGAGRPCLDGRDLLAAQAHLAMELWLGRAPELDTMRRTLDPEATS